jgi:endonuclease III
VQFAHDNCRDAERNNWNDVLEPLEKGSIERLLWGIAFLKSTNGVADKVSCGHFRKLIRKNTHMSLDMHTQPYRIAEILRQTSKWVKNTFVLMNIFRFIQEKWKGVPSQNFHDWINFYEMGPKTTSLLFHSVFDTQVTVPVDSHVWYAFRKWKWTNAKTPDECSWQASQWIPPSYFIKTNDAIGSIRQGLAQHVPQRKLIRSSRQLPLEVRDLIQGLISKK